MIDAKSLFVQLYAKKEGLVHDFGYAFPLEQEIRRILADVLTVRETEQMSRTQEGEQPPINPDHIGLYMHPTDESSLHNIIVDYLVRVEGTEVQSTRDRSTQMEVRRRLLEFVPAGRTVDVRFI